MLGGVDFWLEMGGLPEAKRSVNNPAVRRKLMLIVVDLWECRRND